MASLGGLASRAADWRATLSRITRLVVTYKIF